MRRFYFHKIILLALLVSWAHTATAQTNGVSSSSVNTVGLWANSTEYLHVTTAGNVGIGTTSPQSALQVNGGEVQIGSSGVGCASANAGAMRYASGTMYYCNGSAWNPFSSSCFGSSSGGTDTSLASGLLAYWSFNENTGIIVYDDTGSGKNGQWSGTPGWTTGKIGSGGNFSGVNYVGLAGSISVTNVTVSAWFKTSSNGVTIVDVQSSNPLIYMEIGATTAGGTANKLVAYVRTNLGSVVVANGLTTVNDNNWHLGTIVRNTSTQQIYIYVDGNLDSTTTETDTATITATPAAIGSENGPFIFSGVIDEVGIWNVALTSTQVSALYNSGAGNGYGAFVCPAIVTPTGGFTN